MRSPVRPATGTFDKKARGLQEFRSFFELHFGTRLSSGSGAVCQLIFETSAHSISMMGD
jgi:hypothetical protein